MWLYKFHEQRGAAMLINMDDVRCIYIQEGGSYQENDGTTGRVYEVRAEFRRCNSHNSCAIAWCNSNERAVDFMASLAKEIADRNQGDVVMVTEDGFIHE